MIKVGDTVVLYQGDVTSATRSMSGRDSVEVLSVFADGDESYAVVRYLEGPPHGSMFITNVKWLLPVSSRNSLPDRRREALETLSETISNLYGDRCPDHEVGCATCVAWAIYDIVERLTVISESYR